jgi:hypothetical protein
MQFATKKNSLNDLYITHEDKKISKIYNAKFCGITLNNTPLARHRYINTIMSVACFAIGAVRSSFSQESLKMVHYSYFHLIMMYGIIFRGNFYYCKNIYRMKKQLES